MYPLPDYSNCHFETRDMKIAGAISHESYMMTYYQFDSNISAYPISAAYAIKNVGRS